MKGSARINLNLDRERYHTKKEEREHFAGFGKLVDLCRNLKRSQLRYSVVFANQPHGWVAKVNWSRP